MIKKIIKNDKIIGDYDDSTGIFTSHKTPEFVMIKFGGGGSFGISKDKIDELISLGCHTVIFIYNGKKGIKRFKVNINQYKNSNKTHLNEDVDLQKFVCINDMIDMDAVAPKPEPKPEPPSTKQTKLPW